MIKRFMNRIKKDKKTGYCLMTLWELIKSGPDDVVQRLTWVDVRTETGLVINVIDIIVEGF